MPLTKKLLSHASIRAVAAFILASYVRLTLSLTRFTWRGRDIPQRFWERNDPMILALWHGQIFLSPACWRKGRILNVLISHHQDGDLIARTIAYFGLSSIRGSADSREKDKKKGGAGALRALLHALKDGQSIAVTPDGPRGPRMQASDGIITIARLSGVPIVPVAFVSSRRLELNTWDRFAVNFPLARGAIVWGEPLSIARDASAESCEAARLHVESALNDLRRQAHNLIGLKVGETDISDHQTSVRAEANTNHESLRS